MPQIKWEDMLTAQELNQPKKHCNGWNCWCWRVLPLSVWKEEDKDKPCKHRGLLLGSVL